MVTDEMDNSIQFASIPKLSLQPIIENAIIHGFSDTRSGGLIRISASHVINNCISVRVQDNGKGMDAAKLEQLCDKINAPSLVAEQPGVRQSIGLWNVNRRIKLMYGEKYGMTLYSTPNIGTTVELFFPFQSVEKV
jgi:two-component system sensor histidine kinase YesM